MTNSPEQKRGLTWLRYLPPARWLADYRAAWLPGDIVAGVTLAAYAIPVSLAYAALAGLPPQVGIYGYLLGGLGYALLGSSRQLAVGPTSAISLMIAGTVGAMAGGDARTLRPDRQPRGLHRGRALPARLAAAAERAGAADQRQHPGRLQGRRRADHRHDAVAEPARRRRRRAQFLRASWCCWPASSARSTFSCLRSASSRSCCSCSASACCPASRSRLPSSRCRSSRHGVRASGAGRADDRGDSGGAAVARGPGAAAAGRRGHCSARRRMPAARLYRRRFGRAHFCGQARICARPAAGISRASARPTSRRRWATAIRWRAGCRNRRSTTRPAPARRSRSSSPRSRSRCACCFSPACWKICRRRCWPPSC